jgi:translation initiation factor IF-2
MVTHKDKQKSQEKKETPRRPPVVVVLGHVDHGKSSLLEAIRAEFRITVRESGGITQHIGAYVAEYEGHPITFLDTPGHEAFSAMRSRGAQVADIGILVVAGDEGVKPQTKEAILQAQAAELPLIVAITKTDKPGVDAARVKNELAKEGVIVESIGGQVPCVETSASAKKGIKELLDMILLVAELQDLNTDIETPGTGLVIEVSRDAQRGIQTTLLLKKGSLKTGDAVGTPSAAGKVKILEDAAGKSIKEIGPSFPGLVIGFETSPLIGEEFRVFPSLEDARVQIKESVVVALPQVQEEGQETMHLVVKTDVEGSLEAIRQLLGSLGEDSRFNIVKGDVGDVTEGDVKFARDTKARIVAFRVRSSAAVERFAEREKVPLEHFEVVYAITERLRKIAEEAKEPAIQELGVLRVLATFSTERDRQVIGGRVVTGMAKKGAVFEVMREEQPVGKGRVINLQRSKKDAVSVPKGEEAGLMVQTDVGIQKEDILKFLAS